MSLGAAQSVGRLVARVRGAGVSLSVATVGLCALGSLTLAGSAVAALPPRCSEVASSVTCSFVLTGAPQSFVVPSTVDSITVAAFGAQGGGDTGAPPGLGGEAQAVFAVSPGAVVEVLAGGQGEPFARGSYSLPSRARPASGLNVCVGMGASLRRRPPRARSPTRLNAIARSGSAILSRPFSARSAS